jgi:hypothetical protein
MLKPEISFDRDHATLWSTTLGWRIANPNMLPEWTVALGEGAELMADRYGQRDVFMEELVAVDSVVLNRDESVRPETTVERLASLPPAFRPNG